jgi:hypothetical protein
MNRTFNENRTFNRSSEVLTVLKIEHEKSPPLFRGTFIFYFS